MESTLLLELRQYPQWVIRNGSKIPLKASDGTHASVTDPSHWTDYQTAHAAIVGKPGYGLGFVLTEADPFVVIDLDATDDQSLLANQKEIFNGFKTYSEWSPSRKGCHIWGKGSIPSGKKKDKVEMYSKERYMTVTFEPINDGPVAECQPQCDELFAAMNKGQTNSVPTEFESQPQTINDKEIYTQAIQAANGAKFKELWEGRWQQFAEYPSQSEADQSLYNILAFYSDSAEQIIRLFLTSALGQRDKAKRRDIQARHIKLAFDRKVAPAVDRNNFTITSEVPFQAATTTDKRYISLIRGCDIVEVEQAWLIDEIIPDYTLTGVLGVPGIGKTTLVNGLLAHFSQKDPVLMLTNEDNASDIRRSIKRLGGNLTNLYVEDSATDELPWLLDNCEVLENTLKKYKPRIIGIDSFYSHAPNKADTNKHDSVAPSLVRLRKLANKYCPILLIHHDNKSNTTDPLKKSGGSQGIVGTIRHNVRVHEHPDDENLRLVAVFKTNIGKMNVPSLQFKLDPFEWSQERSEFTASELLQPTVGADADKARRTKTETAKEFLIAEMADGDRLAKEIKERALFWHSIKEDTLDRARKLLAIESHKNTDGVNVWSYAKKR